MGSSPLQRQGAEQWAEATFKADLEKLLKNEGHIFCQRRALHPPLRVMRRAARSGPMLRRLHPARPSPLKLPC